MFSLSSQTSLQFKNKVDEIEMDRLSVDEWIISHQPKCIILHKDINFNCNSIRLSFFERKQGYTSTNILGNI